MQVPDAIKRSDGMPLGKYHEGLSESEFLQMFKEMAGKNKVRGDAGCGCVRLACMSTGPWKRLCH